MLNPSCDPKIAEFLISKRRFDPNLIVGNSTILVHACKENDLEKVKYLVEKCNCDPSFQYKIYYSEWESPLIVACQKGYNDIFVYLIEKCGLMPLCKGAKGKFLLDSTDMKHLEIVKVLIPSSKVDSTEIVLKACQTGNLEIIKTVIEASNYKYPSLQSVVSESPLFVACNTGNMDVINFFYERNCRINFINQEEEGLRLLIKSISEKNLLVVKFIVNKCGCDFPLFRDSDLLFYTACATGSLEIVKYFIEVFKVQYESWSCREIVLGACKSGKIKVVKYLFDKWKLNSHISLEIINEMYSGTNSFDLLKYFLGYIGNEESDIIIKSLFKLLQNVSKMGDLESLELLTSKYEHVFPSKFDSDSICTFVSNACSAKRFDAAKYIMIKFGLSIEDEQLIIFVFYKFGYDINELAKLFNSKTIVAATDKDNNTLLHLACKNDDLAAVEFLLNNSPCPKSCLECQNEEFKAPLHLTTTTYSNVCEYILRNFHSHVDFEMFHIQLRHILHRAYDDKKIEFVKLIFQKNVVPFSLSDQTGDTIFHKACSRGDEEIIEYITKQPECDFLIRNNVGNTPIHCACANTTITAYLLDFILTKGRACFDIANGKGYKPLHLAIEKSNFLLGFLLFKQTNKVFDWLALQLMIKTGMLFHLEEEEDKLLCDIDVLVMNNAFSDNGLSLGQLVYSSGNIRFMKHCISAGLSPFQLTAFHKIIHESNFKFLDYLISDYRSEFVIILNNDVKHAILNCSSIMLAFLTLCQLNLIRSVDNAGDTLLHKACIVGHSQITQKLIDEFDLSPVKENNSGMTPLRNACAHGFIKIAKYIMIRMNSSDFYENPENACLFFDACNSGNIDLVEYLFSQGFQIEIKDKDGNSLLHHACKNENYQMINYLVKVQKLNPQKLNNAGISPLELACRLCNASIVSFFISKADCRNECETSETLQHSPFSDSSSYLATNKVFTLFNVLRDAGCDLSIPDDKGRSLLIKCINRLYNLDSSCTWFLVNACGCDPFNVDSTEKSFFSLAIEKEKQGILNCIQRQYKFEPILQESDNAHLLIYAYKGLSFHFNDIKQLIARGFDPKLPDKNGSTLLHESCRKQDFQMVKYLLDECDCAELCRIEDNAKESPILIAINGMNPSIFEELLHAAKINDPSSLLELNTTYLSVPMLKLFVTKYKCDPKKVKDYNDKTLLHKACRKGDLELVKVLIEECEVDPHQTDWKNQFALTDLLESCSDTKCNDILNYLFQKLDREKLKQHDQDKLLVDKAVENSNIETVQTLIMKGGCRPGIKYLVTHYACVSGRLSLLKFVLKEYNEQYRLIWRCSTDEESVIHRAIKINHMPLMKYLLEHYPAGFTLYYQKPLLNFAYMNEAHKNLDFLKWLIEKAKCNPKSGKRVTLLHLACSAGDYKAVKYLIEEHSCNPSEKDEEGLNSFNRACASGNVELVAYLLRNHNMKKTKYTRESVLHSALKNSHFRIFNMLRQEGFSLSSIDQDGNSLSHLTCGIGNIPLLNICPNVDKEWKMLNLKKQTPLHVACKMRKLDVVKFLVNMYNLKFDAEIFSDILHTWYNNDSTCLNIQEKISFLQFMVTSFGCDIDAKNLNGDSLLHIVASANDLKFCKAMCEKYACKVACTNLQFRCSWNCKIFDKRLLSVP